VTIVWAWCSFNWMGSPRVRALVSSLMRFFCVTTNVNIMGLLGLYWSWLNDWFKDRSFLGLWLSWLGFLCRLLDRDWLGLRVGLVLRWEDFWCVLLNRDWLGLRARFALRRLRLRVMLPLVLRDCKRCRIDRFGLLLLLLLGLQCRHKLSECILLIID